MSLKDFREELQSLMHSESLRPFTCNGSPLDCRVFIVGLNSATELEKPFFKRYWSDTKGFLREQFESDYLRTRKKRGVRPRIEAFVDGVSPLQCLETNIYAVPSRKASYLRAKDKDPRIFEFLLRTIRPSGIVAHSNEPIKFLQSLAGGIDICTGEPVTVEIYGTPTLILGLPGPLFVRNIEEVKKIGGLMKTRVGAS